MTAPTLEAHYLPAVHLLELLELAQTMGVAPSALLAGTELSEAEFSQPNARIPLSTAIALIERAKELLRRPDLGLLLGFKMRVPAHGYVGFAAMTAPTIRHAITLAVRYAPTRTSALALRFEEGTDEAVLYIDELCDLGAAREVVLFSLVVGLWRNGEALTGKRMVGSADLSFPQPSYAPNMAGSPFALHYNKPVTCLRFTRNQLDFPLVMAEPTASLLAQEQCERELESLDKAGLVERVRAALPRPGGGVRTVDEVAALLGTSSRTLHRKLKAESVVFSELADALQHRQACLLLRDEALSIDEVAERVGYANVSNFARAFRRWTGESPASYRKSGGR